MKLSMSLLLLLLLTVVLGSVKAQKYYWGHCPNLTPMSGFEWSKFATGVWFVTRKFTTNSSCLTLEFKTDSDGFRSVEQVRQLPDSLSLTKEYIYTGTMSFPQRAGPGM